MKDGKLRALGVTSAKRSAAAPEIPTLAEQGLAGFEAVSWFALFGPANLPKAVAEKLQAEVSKAIKSPEVSKKLLEIGLEPGGGTAADLAAYQKTEITKWAKVVKASGTTVN